MGTPEVFSEGLGRLSLLLDVNVAWCRIANSGSFVTKEAGSGL